MCVQRFCLPSIVLAAVVLAASVALGLGFELSETKEQLKLKYEVSAADDGKGRVTINLTIEDEGRLAPLDRGVELVVPSKDGTGRDLSVTLERDKKNGKKYKRVQLLKEQAERAEIRLATETLDGKQEPLTWYYHKIPVAEYLKAAPKKK